MVESMFFFLTQNKRHSFIQIDKVHRCNTNSLKTKKDESVNKLTTSMLIA